MDHASVLRAKRDLLSLPKEDVHREDDGGLVGAAEVVGVEVDFRVVGWERELLEAGFDPGVPTAWIIEGLVVCDVCCGSGWG